jgi:hypothetical protein
LDTSQKVLALIKASNYVANEKINPAAFSGAIRSNPNSTKIEILFNSVGHYNIFTKIKKKFDKKIGRNIDIKTTLDAIILKRHQVAHTNINSINLSRRELSDSVIFIKCLVEICDSELYNQALLLDK